MIQKIKNFDELKEYRKMQTFIKTGITNDDILDVMFYIYQKNWVLPFKNTLRKFFYIEFTDYDCVYHQDQKPNLELKGYIVFDILNYFKDAMQNGYIQIKLNKGVGMRRITLHAPKMHPLLLSFSADHSFKDWTIKYMIRELMIVDSPWNLFIKKMLIESNSIKIKSLKDMMNLKRKVGFNGRDLFIEINGLYKNIIEKAKAHPIKTLLGIGAGVAAYKMLNKKNTIKTKRK